MVSFDWDRGFPSKEHGIFVANSDGTGARRLTTAPRTVEAHDTESQWSPDGARIAFTRVKKIGRAAVFVIGADGRGLKRLTGASRCTPTGARPWCVTARARIVSAHG
jgi:Tol biopolymer transport system component